MLPLVVVALGLHLHLKEYVWEQLAHFIEVFFDEGGERAVVLGLDGGGALGLVDEGDFSEEHALLEVAHEHFPLVLVTHPDFAGALGEEEQVVRFLTLPDYVIFR